MVRVTPIAEPQPVRTPLLRSELLAQAGQVFIISMRCGRLANRLNIYANFIGFAAEYGHRVVNCTFHSYAGDFSATRSDIYCRYPLPSRRSVLDLVPGLPSLLRRSRLLYHLTRAVSVQNGKHPLLAPRVVTIRERADRDVEDLSGAEIQAQIGKARVVFVYGWNYRAPDCVERQADKIRAHLHPREPLIANVRQEVQRLRDRAEVLAGVHIRRGDYRRWKQGKYFYSLERYTAWMREFAAQFPGRRVAFLVCSDEPRSPEEFPGCDVAITADTPVADLFGLSQCDFLMGPVSSFSQWASFFGGKPLLQFRTPEDPIRLDKFRVSYLGEIPR